MRFREDFPEEVTVKPRSVGNRMNSKEEDI